MHIGQPFRNVNGILSGMPQTVNSEEFHRLGGMFGREM
jgi:hypothetical protein